MRHLLYVGQRGRYRKSLK